ncbi:MAG TPA: leucine-rich repeat domain-containing protein [Bacilli bacterium]|nr:leucine-rich repeat domain-containing protein [Bacilli bacterium]
MKILKILSIVILLLLVVGCTVDPPVGEETEHTPGLIFELNEDGESYKVVGYEGTSEDIVIASTYNTLPVTSVGFKAKNWPTRLCDLPDQLNIHSITLPESLTSFDHSALTCHQFSTIDTLHIPKNIKYFAHALYNLNRNIDIVIPVDHLYLKEINANGVELVVSIDDKELVYIPFASSETQDLHIPDTIEIVANYAGAYVNYKSIYLSNSTIKIGDYAFINTFSRRADLTSSQIYNFGDHIRYIGKSAFHGGFEVDELIIPRNIEYIGSLAFSYNKIQSVVINTNLGIFTNIFNDLIDNNQNRSNNITIINFKQFDLEDYILDIFIYNFVYRNFSGKNQTIQIILPENNQQAQLCRESIELSIEVAKLRKLHYTNLPIFIYDSSNVS